MNQTWIFDGDPHPLSILSAGGEDEIPSKHD
jgi:hypothetical protein